MKKLWILFFSLAVISTACKKKKDGDSNNDDQQFECLVDKITFTDHSDPNQNEETVYKYKTGTNLIKSKDRSFADGTSYKYNYSYNDENKGLLDRIDIIIQGNVVARVLYTIQNDKTTERKLQVLANDNVTWLDAWTVTYSYNGDKVSQVRIEDYDLWNQGQNPTDETGVYTYTGDNVTNIKWYDTNNMNTVKEEYDFEYDQGKRAFDNVKTQTYPQTRVNNVIHTTHNVYGNNPTTEETFTTLTYNNKGFPTKYEVKDDRNNPLSTEDVEYDNCN